MLFQAYSKAFDSTQKLIEYGRRDETVPMKAYAATWSNNSAEWWVHSGFVPRNTKVTLDANQILIPAMNSRLAKLIARYLPPLPLYGNSYEVMSQPDSEESLQMSDKKKYFDRMMDAYNAEFKT